MVISFIFLFYKFKPGVLDMFKTEGVVLILGVFTISVFNALLFLSHWKYFSNSLSAA